MTPPQEPRTGGGEYEIPDKWRSQLEITEDGCWEWIAYRDRDGYGKLSAGGVSFRAHRYIYELLVAPIGEGMQTDHLCRNPACCNPQHLEVVTARENTLRSTNPAALNARKTHCKSGHPFAGSNLRLAKNGARVCAECGRRNGRAYRMRALTKGDA